MLHPPQPRRSQGFSGHDGPVPALLLREAGRGRRGTSSTRSCRFSRPSRYEFAKLTSLGANTHILAVVTPNAQAPVHSTHARTHGISVKNLAAISPPVYSTHARTHGIGSHVQTDARITICSIDPTSMVWHGGAMARRQSIPTPTAPTLRGGPVHRAGWKEGQHLAATVRPFLDRCRPLCGQCRYR